MMSSTSSRVSPSDFVSPVLAEALGSAVHEFVVDQKSGARAPVVRKSAAKGQTLRPGPRTPLWNTLVDEIRPYLSKRGSQANLARALGFQRQQVNAFFTQRSRMPDGERTLQLLAWLASQRRAHAESVVH